MIQIACVYDAFEESRAIPFGQAFFSGHRAAVSDGGRACTAREISCMLNHAGLRKISIERPDPGKDCRGASVNEIPSWIRVDSL
jgi:hypothetical protein